MTTRRAHRGVRAQPAVALAAALAFLVAACAPMQRHDADVPTPQTVLATGFEDLSSRYIDPVHIDRAALAGLGRLSIVDPAITVANDHGLVRLLLAGRQVAMLPSPGQNDALGWGWLVADMIEAVRQSSPQLHRRSIEDFYTAVFDGALSGLDRYTRYEDPSKAREEREDREGFGGIGVTIESESGETRVLAVYPGLPASRAGLQIGDVIVAVDGVPLAGLGQEAIVRHLRGRPGNEVHLLVKRRGRPAPFDLAVERTHVYPPTVIARRDGPILTLRITSFNQRTALSLDRELRAALGDQEHRIGGIVLDLRANPGGLLDQAVEVANLFIAGGRIIATAGRHPDSDQVFNATVGEPGEKLPMVVLINGRSASAAEIVAAALADRGRALTVGSTTYGKGSVQTIVRLPNGGELIITWAHLYTPSGRSLNGVGVTPALCTADNSSRDSDIVEALRARRASLAMLTRPVVGGCPRDPEVRAVDGEIARRLLSDVPLYTAMLAVHRPAVAAR